MKIFFCMVAGWLLSVSAFAQVDTLKYRVYLRDKALTSYRLSDPEEFLSKRAVQRRLNQHLEIDSTDLPVCETYLNAIRACGVTVVVKSKWQNSVMVSCCSPHVIQTIENLPFVVSTKEVWRAFGGRAVDRSVPLRRDSIIHHKKKRREKKKEIYGLAYNQIHLCGGDALHDAGFKGEGMSIAVIDAGFHNLDRIASMDGVKVLGVKDFVNPNSDIYAEHNHGLGVLSCMAMDSPGVMVGTAPKATYWLLRSEDSVSEQEVEQDYWAAAVEYADSVGADLINSSLGYQNFDNPAFNYRHYQLDGRTAFISRQASMIAGKGMILVNSAGNTGEGSWKKITPPADASDILTVGAVDADGLLSTFSAVGNSADGRVKPDVVAMGSLVYIMGTSGSLRKANGTSFAAPVVCGLVACLWQALPQLTAKEIINIVRQSGDRYDHPDNIYGFGLPDVWSAYLKNKEIKE